MDSCAAAAERPAARATAAAAPVMIVLRYMIFSPFVVAFGASSFCAALVDGHCLANGIAHDRVVTM
jgi:hypothetical protein